MAIFGLKSRKSYSSDTSSLTKRKTDTSSRNHNLEASDVVGDTPEFGQLNTDRRGPSHTSDSSSLLSRNSTSMKKFFGSTRRKGSQSVDIGSSPGNNIGSPASDYFNNATSKRASRTSLNKHTVATPASPPVITPSAVAPSLSTPAEAGPATSFTEAVGRDVSGGLAPSSTPPAGPRPSDLFAGKGVQWEQLDLTSRTIPKTTDAAATTVDMQKFLKERRQWIPTFKEEEAVKEAASVQLPKSLDQFSFATPAEVVASSAGLKSLRDLEDTHKRKAALLNEAPLASATNGTIFEEAAPTTASANATKSAAAAAGTASSTLPPPPAPPSRNQSFRTSTFVASNDSAGVRPSGSLSRKPTNTLGVNGGSVPASAPASRDIPQRRSSVQKDLSELGSSSDSEKQNGAEPSASTNDNQSPRLANGRVEQIKEQARVTDSAATEPAAAASGSVRPSMDTAAFATPTGSQSNDGEHGASTALAQQDVPKTSTLSTQEASQDSGITVARPTSPPRPPKNGQRTPSRQSSAEPIRVALSKSPSTTFKPTEEQPDGNTLVEKLVQTAPALQNVVPGTGAATTRDA
ncbi:uncharacterized protein SPSC_03388 [Sporisorium scitamineum]|uniref:Uncharacterized protein n=1 Tax=Sporisorium scitamineum TaxID=49012 RepID=A0A0F7RY27_9BASI|nr:hypothetical protein [Sporisorium scitamineum]CDU24317.1 uncharacterized protein SPSC_03388 [Sporisorium scitamineum]